MKKQSELYELLNEKNTLNEIQNYIKEVIKIRGFSEQKVQDKMLLLLEETEEICKGICYKDSESG